jgi:N-methylhydantoinase A
MAGHGEMEKPRLAALAPNHDAVSNPRAGRRPVYFAEGGGRMDGLVYQRRELPAGFEGRGPALIEEYGSTTVVGPNDHFEIGPLGEIRIQIDLAQ